MTTSKVLFDALAWWEVLPEGRPGDALHRRYLDASGFQVLTAAITLGELAGKLSSEGASDSVPPRFDPFRTTSMIVDLTEEPDVASRWDLSR